MRRRSPAGKHIGLHPMAIRAGIAGEVDEDQLVLGFRLGERASRSFLSQVCPVRATPAAGLFRAAEHRHRDRRDGAPNMPGIKLMAKIRNAAPVSSSRNAEVLIVPHAFHSQKAEQV